ncbi:MAG: phenylacetate--CoA ligase family protein [Desulfobacterales bacterium]
MEKSESPVCVPGEREQMILERLQSTLNRAFRHVPFHQARMRELGIDPAAVRRIEDLEQLPFMERRHLSENYPYGLFAVPLRDIVRIHTAPGIAENPTVTGYTAQDLKTWQGIVATALGNAGVTPDDILQISLDTGLANWGRDYQQGAESMGASVIPNTLLSLEKQLMLLRDYKTSVLVTTPSYALRLYQHLEAQNIEVRSLAIRTLILVGEAAGSLLRDRLESGLNVTTWQHYGLTEVPGPAVAFECESRNGLHVNDDHFLPEIIDPATGRVLPAGTEGELVLTTLTTRAYPLIRFRTGDRGRILDASCACECRLTRIDWLEGRTDDLMVARGVKVSRSQLESIVTDALGFAAKEMVFFVSGQQGRTYLEAWIAVDDRCFSDEIKVLENRVAAVRSRIEEDYGVPALVRLKEPPLKYFANTTD